MNHTYKILLTEILGFDLVNSGAPLNLICKLVGTWKKYTAGENGLKFLESKRKSVRMSSCKQTVIIIWGLCRH